MKLTCTRSRGLLLQTDDRSSFWQFTVGRGNELRRFIWWPHHGQISVRLVGSWWFGFHWNRPKDRKVVA